MFNILQTNYRNIAYSITKGFLNEYDAKFYLYWERKINNIDISKLYIVDKVFVLMCKTQRVGVVHAMLEDTYNTEINEKDIYDILINCQSFDIEITVMAKSFLTYQYKNKPVLDEQIYHIMEYGNIDLPYGYEINNHI